MSTPAATNSRYSDGDADYDDGVDYNDGDDTGELAGIGTRPTGYTYAAGRATVAAPARRREQANTHRTSHTAARPGKTRGDGPSRGRRVIALTALAALVVGALIAGNGLVSCGNSQPAAKAVNLPVTSEQATRLAGVRLADYRAGRAAVHVTIGSGTSAVHLTGWVDWRQSLIYLNSLGSHPGPSDGMIQAEPGIIAIRPGRYTPPAAGNNTVYDPYPAPPLHAPPTGWQIRGLAAGSSIDTMVTLLLALRSTTVDSASQIAAIGTRYVGTDEIAGDKVEVMDGAAVPPPAPKPGSGPTPTPARTGLPFASNGGQVRYWVAAHSKLLRVAALVNATTGLQIDFDQSDRTVPSAIELLGGAPIKPTKLTTKQANLLAGMRLADYRARGGSITLAVPASSDELLSATGWLDWPRTAAYVSVRNVKASGADATVRADATGLTIHGDIDGTGAPTGNRPPLASPPIPAPDTGWKRVTWASRQDAYGEPDFDLLLNEMLALWAPSRDDASDLKKISTRLRTDSVDGIAVTVFEVRKPAESHVTPGDGRLRYWVDADGLLRRLELRTRTGAWGYLTFTPGDFPNLPNPVKARS